MNPRDRRASICSLGRKVIPLAVSGELREKGRVIELTLPVSPAFVDALDECLLEQGDPRWMVLQDVIVQSANLVAVFASEAEAWASWKELRLRCAEWVGTGEPQIRILADEDWRDSYKAHFKSWRFGRLHWVPVWERPTYIVPSGDAVIWLDPGLAFGTGNHETTRLCCERLVTLSDSIGLGANVIDAGCGSGILALSAIRLGFSQVTGFDNDPEAVRVSEENAAANELTGWVDFFIGDLVAGLRGRTAKIVLANIQADVLMRYASELLDSVEGGGALVLSGILAEEIAQVRDIFEGRASGWRVESRILGEWTDLMLLRPPISR